MKDCVIFGAATTGGSAYEILKKEYNILGFADNSQQKWGDTFCGKKIFSPKELLEFPDSTDILIASIYYAEIYHQLQQLGLKNVKVFQPLAGSQDKYTLYELPSGRLFEDCVIEEVNINYKDKKTVKEGGKSSEKMSKKVLFCAYAFPPLGGSGVQRSLKFVKYLKKYGYEPIVLTVGEHDGVLPEDTSMLAELDSEIQIIRIDQKTILPELLDKKSQQEIYNLYYGIIKDIDWMEEFIDILPKAPRLIPDNRIMWVYECMKHIAEVVDLSEIDVVYTTGSPYSTYIIGYYLKEMYGIKWVQDYRDPWASNDYYSENVRKAHMMTVSLEQRLEKVLANASDALITMGLGDEYVKKYGVRAAKIFDITNGYDEDDFREIDITEKQNDKFTICHNGKVYIDRNPIGVLEVINSLIEEGKINASKIQWIFNGTLDKIWYEKLQMTDKWSILRYNGYLEHLESIQSAMSSDMLILLGLSKEGFKYGYTGKVFEYLRMKTPILSLSTRDSVLGELLAETGTGSNFAYDEKERISEFILKQYRAWEQGQNIMHYNEKEIVKYSRENLTKKLVDVFDYVLEK